MAIFLYSPSLLIPEQLPIINIEFYIWESTLKSPIYIFVLVILIFVFSIYLPAQQVKSGYYGPDSDPCGYDEKLSKELYKLLGAGWGYNYDSLLTDLDK